MRIGNFKKQAMQKYKQNSKTEIQMIQALSKHDAFQIVQNTLSNILTNIRCSFCLWKTRRRITTFPVLWNLCLAARAEGLGTFITTLLKLRKQEVEQLLGMPEGFWHMHAMIPIGYPTGRWGTLAANLRTTLFIQNFGIIQSHGPVSQTGQSPRTTDATTNKGKDGFRNT